MEKISAEILESFKNLPNVGDVASRALYNEGFRSIQDVAEVNPEDLARVLEIEKEKAEEIAASALQMIHSQEGGEAQEPAVPPASEAHARASVEQLEGVGEKTAETLTSSGFRTINDILKSEPEALSALPGIGAKKAEKLIQAARKYSEGKTGE